MRKKFQFLIFCSTIVTVKSLSWQDVVQDKNPAVICNKTFYEENFVKKEAHIPMWYLNRTCYTSYHKTCHQQAGQVRYTHGTNENGKMMFLIQVVDQNEHSAANKGCWGIVVEYNTSTTEAVSNYDFFNHREHFLLEYVPNETYWFTVAAVPTGLQSYIRWTSPSKCEKDVLDDINNNLGDVQMYEKCLQRLNLVERNKFALKLCKRISINATERRRIISISLDPEKCTLKDATTEPTATPFTLPIARPERKTTFDPLHAVIASVVFIVFVFACGTCALLYRKRKNVRVLIHREASQEDHLIPGAKSWNGKESPSVMILNRPGCELLEIFLRDLACILQSYGMDVKLALLEQNQLDAEGGIASYMQKHIDECDYILIMFTEKTQEKNRIMKHRPYEFTLKMLGGLAFHQNDCSRYLPMYLKSYNEAVNLLPPFLNSSTTFGYRLPKDTDRLIRRLLGVSKLEISSERTVKDKYFLERMIEKSKAISALQHPHCSRENCTKGMLNASVDNLSSIWPSTIHSKWQSSQSVHTPHLSMRKANDISCENLILPSNKDKEKYFHTEDYNNITNHDGSTHQMCEDDLTRDERLLYTVSYCLNSSQ